MIIASDNRKTALLGMVAAIGGLLFFVTAVLMPLAERQSELDRRILSASVKLEEMAALAERYASLYVLAPATLPHALQGRSIGTEVERVARHVGMEEKIKRMSPIRSASKQGREEVALTVSGISNAELVDFLKNLYESPMPINVSRAKIKPGFKKRSLLEVEMTLSKAL